MRRLVPVLLALLAGCGEPTIPDRLGIEVGDHLSIHGPSISSEYQRAKVVEISGNWVMTYCSGSVAKSCRVWLDLREANRIEILRFGY